MPARAIRAFGGGLSPRTDRRLLRDDQAQIASNADITSGALTPLRLPRTVYTSSKAGALKSAHRLTDTDGDDVFLAWNTDVDAVRALLANDSSQFVYYTGDGEPRRTSLAQAISLADNKFPDTCFVLGVVRPTIAPTLGAISGGSGATETRLYVFTFVAKTTLADGTVLEEEGPPSDSVGGNGKVDDTWVVNLTQVSLNNSNTITTKSHSSGVTTVSGTSTLFLRAGEYVVASSVRYRITEIVNSTQFKVADSGNAFPASGTWTRDAPHNTASMVKRVYRSTGTDFFKVADVALATTFLNDNILAANLPGPTLLSTSYEMPPADLHSLIALPNGSLAGISGTRLCLSEAGLPHAWPSEYQKYANYQGVSLGHLGQTVVMTTEGAHYVATGTDPSAMTFEGAQVAYPCLSKRGTVSLPVGVAWPTHEGIAVQGPTGAFVITKGLYTKRQWSDDETGIDPSSIFAANYDGRYVGSYLRPGSEVREILILDPSDQSALFSSTIQADGLYADRRNGKLYVLQGSSVREWDADVRAQMDWQSKEFLEPTPLVWTAAKIDIDLTQSEEEKALLQAAWDAVADANEVISASAYGWKGGEIGFVPFCHFPFCGIGLQNLPVLSYQECGFYLYRDNVPIFYKRVTNDRGFRVNGGEQKYDNESVRVITNVTVRAILLGTNMKELGAA